MSSEEPGASVSPDPDKLYEFNASQSNPESFDHIYIYIHIYICIHITYVWPRQITKEQAKVSGLDKLLCRLNVNGTEEEPV